MKTRKNSLKSATPKNELSSMNDELQNKMSVESDNDELMSTFLSYADELMSENVINYLNNGWLTTDNFADDVPESMQNEFDEFFEEVRELEGLDSAINLDRIKEDFAFSYALSHN